ncbi:MAG: ABC transporter permease [Phycisphaerae bacterium]
MNLAFFFETLRLALTNLYLHKLRSFLTSLGIVIGVGAVITMLAIGEGAKRKTIHDVEMLGATNIIMRSTPPPESNNSTAGAARELVYGLKRADLDLIRLQIEKGILPRVELLVPLRDTQQDVIRAEVKASANAIATTPEFPTVANLNMAYGSLFSQFHMDDAANGNVCVLGAGAAQQPFGAQSGLQRDIKIGGKIFKVIGVLQPVGLAGGKGSALTGRDLNADVYFPLTTNARCFSDVIVKRNSGSFERKIIELSEIYLRVATADQVEATAAALQRLMDIRHAGQADVRLVVPRELLNQADQSARTFTFVMGGIAFLSLLIGGIGIMNISLATVTERTREIGIRRALGGKRKHIIMQFLVETMSLSITGGLFGIGAGVGLAVLIQFIAGDAFPTHVAVASVVLSFTISALVGILAGLYPAVVAAYKDPIEALRHD